MKLTLAAIDTKLVGAWTTFFAAENDVSVIEGDITTLKCDAIVSPSSA